MGRGNYSGDVIYKRIFVKWKEKRVYDTSSSAVQQFSSSKCKVPVCECVFRDIEMLHSSQIQHKAQNKDKLYSSVNYLRNAIERFANLVST